MFVIEAGGENLVVEESHFEIITAIKDFGTVRDALSDAGHAFSMAELRYLPQTMTELTTEEDIKYMNKFIDLLEEDDDVQNMYHNWEEAECIYQIQLYNYLNQTLYLFCLSNRQCK